MMQLFKNLGRVGFGLLAGGLMIAGWGCQAQNNNTKTASATRSGEQIVWQTDVRAAAQDATRLKKPLLLKFTASWCGYCQKMKAETFTDASVAARVNSCFVPVEVDADEHPKLMEALEIEGLPTTVILTHDLKVLEKVVGYRTAAEFQPTLASVCDQQKPTQVTGQPRERQ